MPPKSSDPVDWPRKYQNLFTLGVKAQWFFLILVIGFLLTKAALQFIPHYDTIAYHLPAALHAWNITTYVPEPSLVDVINGMPPLAHWFQGGFVFLTGRMSTANLINPLAFIGAAFLFSWIYSVRGAVRWFLTLTFCVPLVLIHCLTSYIDLWSGSFLFLAFISLARLQNSWRLPALSSRKKIGVLLICLMSMAAAVNSKFQTWPVVLCLALWLVPIVWSVNRERIISRTGLTAILIFSAILTGYTPIRNLIQFGNPTFPIANPVFKGNSAHMQGVNLSNTAELQQQIPRYLWSSPQWLRFVESVFEVNRLQPSKEPFRWSIDQGGGTYQGESPHHRMGGWFFVTVILLIFLCGAGIWSGAIPRASLLMLVTCLIVIAFCPQSHELRYWLFMPLSAAALGAVSLVERLSRGALLLRLAIVLLAVFVTTTVLSPFDIHLHRPMAYAPRQAIEYWLSQEKNPSNKVLMTREVKPFAIFWSGPDFNSYRVRDLGNGPGK